MILKLPPDIATPQQHKEIAETNMGHGHDKYRDQNCDNSDMICEHDDVVISSGSVAVYNLQYRRYGILYLHFTTKTR